MAEIINPYIAGAPVTESRMFFGREDVFDWIQNSLVGKFAEHILVIHGQRRVGKTSVLKQLGNRLPERYIPVFFDLQGRTHTTLERFLWWLAREIVHVLKQEHNIEITLPDKEAFVQDAEYFENHFLPGLWPTLGDHTLLLTFDEFDNLEESEIKESLSRPLVDYLRRLMGREGLNFIFSIGSSGRKLENMQAAYTEFFKAALYKKISFLSKEQTLELVTRPVEGVLVYEHTAVDQIYRVASGHPYFTQLTCHELFAHCQRTEQRKITESDVKAILDDVVERGTVNLKFVWDEASDIEKWGLAGLAHLQEKADTPAVADFLHKQRLRFSESELISGILHLREKDVLTHDNRFVIQLLKLWLQKNRPIEQVREELTEVNPIANRYIEIGLEFKNAGTYDKACESFQEALAVDADNIQAQVNIGLVYMDKKAYDKAVVEFEKALKIDDEDVTARSGLCEAHLALGDTAMQKGRPKEAVQSYQRVLAINAEHTEVRGRMAEIQRQRAEKALTDGRADEAIVAFAEALKFTPEDKALAKRYEEANIERRTKMLTGLLAKAEKERSVQNREAALATLKQAEKIDPGNETVQKQIAAMKAEQHEAQLESILARAEKAENGGRWEQAISALGEYLTLEPDNVKIQRRLENARKGLGDALLDEARANVSSLVRQGRFEEAGTVWKERLKTDPGQAQAIQAELDHLKQAQARALAESHQQQLDAILLRADRAEAAGRWEPFISALEEYLSREPDDEKVRERLEQARKDLQKTRLEEARKRAEALARQEHFEEALTAWQGLLKIDPEQEQAVKVETEKVQQALALAKPYAEAEQALAKKDYDQAVSLLKGILNKDENYKETSRLLAQAIQMRRSRRKGWQSRWLLVIPISLVVAVVVWFALQPGVNILNSLLKSTGSPTMMAAANSTAATTQVAASTSSEQILAFAQPYLDASANQLPDYTDDFSDPNSGWPSGKTQTGSSGLGIGERGYIDGEYFLRATYLPSDNCCLDSHGGNSSPQFSDFVMAVDFRFVSGNSGSACIDSRRLYDSPDRAWYSICFSLERKYEIYLNIPKTRRVTLASGSVPTFKTGPATNNLRLIARGDQMAFFLNGESLQLIYDDAINSGVFGFWIESETSTPLEVRFDNLKVWKITSLLLSPVTHTTSAAQIRPFADPILSAVAERSADIEDDFSDPSSGWPEGSTSNGDSWGYKDGTYTLSLTNTYSSPNGAPCLDLISKNQPQFSDFVLEFDAQVVSSAAGNWHTGFRIMQPDPKGKDQINYFIDFYADGTVGLFKQHPPEDTLIWRSTVLPSFLQETGKHRVTIVAQGTSTAVYVDGEPLVLANDPTWQAGRISLWFGACNDSNNDSSLEVRFGNLKVWNIASLQQPVGKSLVWKQLNDGQFLPRDPITAIVIDPGDPGVMYIGTKDAGIYKSIDSGVSWLLMQNGLGRASVNTLIIDPSNSKILYAGTILGGIYKTIDGGITWQAMNNGVETQKSEWVAIIVMDAQNSQHLFFSHGRAIFETHDGGVSWVKVIDIDFEGSCPSSFEGLVLDPTYSNILYTEVRGNNHCQLGIYKSTDAGKSWKITDPISQAQDIQRNGLWIDPLSGQRLYFSSGDSLWVSTDEGNTWTVSTQTNCSSLVFDTQDPLTAFCSIWEGIMKTSDGGTQWKKIINSTVGQAYFLAISPHDNHTLFWGGTGLYISKDSGGTWQEHGSGLKAIGWDLKISSADTPVFAAQVLDETLYLSQDNGLNWDTIGSGQSLSFGDHGTTLFTLQDGYLGISSDLGANWRLDALPAGQPQAIAVHPTIPERIYALYGRNAAPYIYYSNDLGQTWQGTTGMQDIYNPRIFFDYPQGNVVYAVGDLNISSSNDAGTTWKNCGNFEFLWASAYDMRAAVDPINNDHIFIATISNGIVASQDYCKSWQTSNTGLANLFVNTIAIDPYSKNVMYAATDGGAYIYTDGGKNWSQINAGLGSQMVVYSIMVDKYGDVYATTPDGFFQLGNK